jgi:nucleoside 2-deoxyribosyltransferase
MKLYIAGPLFTPCERGFLDGLADRSEAARRQCFVPHRETIESFDAATNFATDSAGLRGAEAVVARPDCPMVDGGTACELGIFSELVRTQPDPIEASSGSPPTGASGADAMPA